MSGSARQLRVMLSVGLGVALLVFGGEAGADGVLEASVTPEVAAALPSETVAVTGTIQVAELNFLGRPIQVQIVSRELGTVRIALDDKGEELKAHVGDTVTLRAQRAIDDLGHDVLAVQSYELHESGGNPRSLGWARTR